MSYTRQMKMERLKSWLGFKQTFLFSAKCMLLKFTSTSRLRRNAQRHNDGLMNLYKDMESCGEDTDIRVMWDMIQSSYFPNDYSISNCRRKKVYWKFCFRPT
ncbi:uncharacterized protein LOC126664909 [Mercurialis annua]|uniref:uncharacterized protein LOC126664909 n=1 Tax=Mercurialis annua TaxID=3986 RepID=UPI002160A31B|nr:uncharacterized protein LOC126664909 [Mercurialis annua]